MHLLVQYTTPIPSVMGTRVFSGNSKQIRIQYIKSEYNTVYKIKPPVLLLTLL